MGILYFFSTMKSIRIFNHFSSSLQCFCQYQNKKVKENNSSSHRLELENKKNSPTSSSHHESPTPHAEQASEMRCEVCEHRKNKATRQVRRRPNLVMRKLNFECYCYRLSRAVDRDYDDWKWLSSADKYTHLPLGDQSSKRQNVR